jgi:hypothetical protein
LISGAALLLPLTAATESQIRIGSPSASASATAQLNFKIIIPKVLYLRVGRDGVILSGSAGKAMAQMAVCSSDGQPVLAGSRLICTASMP